MVDTALEFAVRYYQWAARESRTEMDAGFPLVSRLRNQGAETYLSVMDNIGNIGTAERRRYLTASIKRFHPKAVDLLGEEVTREEETLLEWADQRRMEIGSTATAPAHRIQSRKLLSLLKSELQTRLGREAPLVKTGPKMFCFESKHGPWVITTRFDCGRSPHYYHSIEGDGMKLASHISIQSWMGISSMTDWNMVPAGCEDEVARAMTDATQRFLGHAEDLLKELLPL